MDGACIIIDVSTCITTTTTTIAWYCIGALNTSTSIGIGTTGTTLLVVVVMLLASTCNA